MSLIDPETEHLYMPSNWVVRVPPDQSVPLHVQVTSEESRRVRDTLADKRLGLKYGPGDEDKVDMFGEEGREPVMMLYISGGYWQELSGDISAYTVQPLVTAGHRVAVAHYTRCPAQDLAGITAQLVRLGAWLLEYAKARGLRLVMSGHSAGAHLAAMMLTSDWFMKLERKDAEVFKGVVHLSGVFDLAPILKTSVNIPQMGINEGNVSTWSPLSDHNIARLSKQAKHIRFWIVVGENDSPAFKSQAKDYYEKLVQNKFNVTMTEQEIEDHFSLVEKLKDQEYSLSKAIINFMRGK